jgi:4-hydroxy-tetrahydrodipicolinate reductase
MTSINSPTKFTKLILVGATGKLGKSITINNHVTYGICSKDNPLLGKIIDDIQEPLISSLSEVNFEVANEPLVIDASYPENFDNVYDFCYKNKTPLVLASTGHQQKQIKKLEKLAKKVAVLKAPNLSEGIAFFKQELLMPMIQLVKRKIYNSNSLAGDSLTADIKIKIRETHHEKKKDAPSGTALDLKDFIQKDINSLEIEIESLRDKLSVGKHEVIFTIKNEEFIVSHNALSRDIFGEGIKLALSLKDKNPGIYLMADLLKG